ncbi:flap endonuclease [Anaerofilum sp. BX8]|uniref:5'-3' exonuclease n=1 Tax=Anaerofilum hominis TaxID=2763016 RepID=A0A923RED7_9FIRM|nr:5'-3' exonuclease H3TH domain-containing protein [Anaerofilum hominis]MBC5582240.1 flap endonuclease [Anaerofilum hominis]
MDRLLIIDGSNLLFQMFYGMPARIVNREGKAIQGTLGFVGAAIKMIGMTQPTHLVVLFDGEHPNSRTELLAEYKANRPDYSQAAESENPFSQLADVRRALTFMGIRHTEVQEFETDDVAASYAYACGAQMSVVISSFDSDFFQLISENVNVLRYRGKKSVLCDVAYLKEKLGVAPCRYADFKSLTGDSSDNIKGADKIGPKTAAQLLCEFDNLENLIANAEKIPKPSVRASIIQNVGLLRRNYQLIKLDTRAALPFSLKELEYRHSGLTTNEVLAGIGLK